MPRISRATKIESDDTGYVRGELISLEYAENSKFNEQLEWVFAVTNSLGKKSLVRVWTGLNINDEKTYYPEDGGKPQYNKLTQMLLGIGKIDEKTLHSKEEIDLDLNDLTDKEYLFKLVPDKKNPALKRLDVSSIKLSQEVNTEPTAENATSNKVAE